MQADSRSTVVFIESAAAMGGVQFSTFYLVQALDRSCWRPIVLCPTEGDLTYACQGAGVETVLLRQSKWRSTSLAIGQRRRLPNPFAWIWNALVILRAAGQVASLLRKLSPDVVVTKGLPSHFIGGFAARIARVPCVWHVQDFISERTFGIYRLIFGLPARWLPRQIIVDGASIKKQLPRSVQSRTTVIHNGVDTELFRPSRDSMAVREELHIPKDNILIGHAGRITSWKGQHYLIEAFAQIANEHPNVSLLFAGSSVFGHDGYERRLRGIAASRGLQDRITFAGYRRNMPETLAAMDIFAFTSIEKDTSPLALLSAMSCGLPIAAFDIEGVRELIDADEESLLLTPVADVDRLAESLQRLLSDQKLRLRLSQSARRAAETKFSLDQYVSRIENILLRAARGSSSAIATSAEDVAKPPSEAIRSARSA